MYVGRFAPTTSGPLHLGSLLAAVASYLDARSHGGKWLLRLDDIDEPRTRANAEKVALTTLERHGLEWDGVIGRQTDHQDQYWNAIEELRKRDLIFYCTCSRKKLRNASTYPGYCRTRRTAPHEPASIRVRVRDDVITFTDRVQGAVRGNLTNMEGDFIVMRKESIAAYPLAVIVDDDVTGVTDIVRGADLLENTLVQIFLIQTLGLAIPRYAHIPVLNQRNGIKLSKRDLAFAIDNRVPLLNLLSALHMLGLDPSEHPKDVHALLQWAIEQWNIQNVPKAVAIADFMSI